MRFALAFEGPRIFVILDTLRRIRSAARATRHMMGRLANYCLCLHTFGDRRRARPVVPEQTSLFSL
jgi:hypothetical protein